MMNTRHLAVALFFFGAGAICTWLISRQAALQDPATTQHASLMSYWPSESTPPHSSDPVPVHRVPQHLPVPEQLFFCGEEVDLSDPDILERYEKELYILANLNYQVVFHLKRAPRIFPYIEEQLRKHDMPEDLKYLAVVESDLIPILISTKGARGLWQFMPATARDYGMKVAETVDERLHLDKSTEAAFRYLKNAREKTGSWAMAAAAYNMGLARAINTMKEQYVTDYYRLHMNQETARYVFKMLAVKTIMENPHLYGYDTAAVAAYPNTEVRNVRVTGPVRDLPKWAIENGTTYYDLRRLNPWMVGQSLPAGTYDIQVP